VCDYNKVMSRPRKFPDGATANDRVAASTAALREAGGARKTFRLSPEAHTALKTLMRAMDAPPTETALIERLLLSAVESHRKELS
jgi:hypothetical protein